MTTIGAVHFTPFLLLLLVSAVASAQKPASRTGAAGADPVVGTFTDGQLTLRLDGGGGRYTGYGDLEGVRYPLEFSGRPDSLRGTYLSDGERHPVDARVASDTLEIRADASFYRLWRVADTGSGSSEPAPPDTLSCLEQ